MSVLRRASWMNCVRVLALILVAVWTTSTSAQDVLFDYGADWSYFPGTEAPSDPAEAWRGSVFDDSAWAVGATGIGYGDDDDVTVLDDMVDSYTSVFARKTFNVANPAALSNLVLGIDFDDGFIAFLNGIEVARAQMGAEGEEFLFDATSAAGHEAGDPEFFALDSSALVAGDNVLAIQIHNTTIGSSDFSFNARLTGNDIVVSCPSDLVCSTTPDGVALSWTSPAVVDSVVVTRNGTPIAGSPFAGDVDSATDTNAGGQANTYEVVAMLDGQACPALSCTNDPTQIALPTDAEWSFFRGTQAPSEPPTAWRTVGFDDSAWETGMTGIGYADGDDVTVLDDMEQMDDDPDTPDVDESQPGYLSFFARTSFDVPDAGAVDTAILSIDYDDGFVCFVNGQEVARSDNMGPAGQDVAFDTPAGVAHEAGTAEEFAIPSDVLVSGANVIAVQIHNSGIGSSDASFIPSIALNGCPVLGGLTCVQDEDTGAITLNWNAGSEVDFYTVTRNGVALPGSPFDGDSTTIVDTNPSVRDNEYEVVATSSGAECATLSCSIECGDLDPENLTCSLALVAGVTQATLDWTAIPGATSIEVEREGTVLATLEADANSFLDLNVESDEPENDTEYSVIFNFADGSTCTLSCGPISLCPENFVCVPFDDGDAIRPQLQWDNVVKNWDSFSILRDGAEIAIGIDGLSSTYVDTEVSLTFGVSYEYTLMPLAPLDAQVGCNRTCTVGGDVQEVGSFDEPAGAWDYLVDFSGAGDLQYNAVAGESGNIDGQWIRAIDFDSWDGSAPIESGVAPDGLAPGGLEFIAVGEGACGEAADALSIVNPGNTNAPGGSLAGFFPDAFALPNNNEILLGLDAGGDGNLLRDGVTFVARWRLSSDAPEFMNPTERGDGAPLAGGRGQIGFYYRDTSGEDLNGVTTGLSFALQSGDEMHMSTAPVTVLEGTNNLTFRSIWVTVQDPEGDDTYDINVYLNGETVTTDSLSQIGADLQAGTADFGAPTGNYLAIGLPGAGADAAIDIDFVGYKVGVHTPESTLCVPSDNNRPTADIAASPGTTLTLTGASTTLTLDGSGSDDGDGGAQGLTYQWSKIAGPGGETIATPGGESTEVTLTQTGSYRFQLRVDDGEAARNVATAVVDIQVNGVGGGVRFVRGDSDGSGVINLSDGIQILFWSFQGGPEPSCLDAADTDDSGVINLTDPVRIFQWLFLGGLAPALPMPTTGNYLPGDCGEDVNLEDPDLTCLASGAPCQ